MIVTFALLTCRYSTVFCLVAWGWALCNMNKTSSWTILRMINPASSVIQYPLTKKVFVLKKTSLPSSAPVERLFSIGGQILTPRKKQSDCSAFWNVSSAQSQQKAHSKLYQMKWSDLTSWQTAHCNRFLPVTLASSDITLQFSVYYALHTGDITVISVTQTVYTLR